MEHYSTLPIIEPFKKCTFLNVHFFCKKCTFLKWLSICYQWLLSKFVSTGIPCNLSGQLYFLDNKSCFFVGINSLL